ncbi:hypothetical protein [Halalkalirubrum salinum]|nr:hypothetical protein [Halalkalirubrum salinum]
MTTIEISGEAVDRPYTTDLNGSSRTQIVRNHINHATKERQQTRRSTG